MVDREKLKQLLLTEGREDHLGLWWVVGEVSDRLPSASGSEIRAETLAVIGELLEKGLLLAGFPKENGKDFEPWSGSSKEVIARIDAEWAALGREPNIGEIVWFATTEAGDRAAVAPWR